MRRVGIFGWGLVAPRSPNIEAFAANLASNGSWLGPFNGFGPDNFLVGVPEFQFSDYRDWIASRFPPARFHQLEEKMDLPVLYAIGCFIQALGQNPGLEEELRALGTAAHIYMGTGIGCVQTVANCTRSLDRGQRRWDRFWAERNPAFRNRGEAAEGAPPDPDTVADPEDRYEAESAWLHYWAASCPDLQEYLRELAEIEGLNVQGDIEKGKVSVLKEKQRRLRALHEKWQEPTPPWQSVSPNLVWNIWNTPAAQISMMGHINGLAFAPVAACSTFGVCLKLGMDAIRRGEAKAVVIGATDPPPLALSVGAFYSARVISADAAVSKPLTGLRGTHVAGGAVLWILGDLDYMREKGLKPLGMEPVAVGVSSDADHIITPSIHGPTMAMQNAFAESGIRPEDLATWDLHATATPGDFREVETLRGMVPESVVVTARKGIFGHGMSAGGGWELTAQYLGFERGQLFPTSLRRDELNREIAGIHDLYVFDEPCPANKGVAGKLSMGIGGINACVISRPL
ncbi:MAG TPA: beta-ketoacyl synthase N-terminal-like domain-containing protein [Thermoanaerobaculia bacterium]